MRTSRSPTTVMTANSEVQTREEATLCVKQLDFFVKVMLPEETPQFFPLGKLCEGHGYTNHWTSGQKPHLTKNGNRIGCNFLTVYHYRIDCNFLTVYHLGFLVYQRVLPQLHLHILLHHLHHRILYLMPIDTPKKSSTRKKWKCE